MRFGYACKTLGVSGGNFSSCTLKTATEENIRNIINNNLNALENIIDYNKQNKIRFYRISSDIVPFATHEINKLDWKSEFKDRLNHIGNKITQNSIRVSMHPGQYSVLNSPNNTAVKNTIKDLIYHCDILDLLNQDIKSKIILHIGGVYGDKLNSIHRFIPNFAMLPSKVKERLIIENDDKNYTISEVLDISKQINIPVVFDNLHNELNPSNIIKDESEWIKLARETWQKKDGIQKIHYSQQKYAELKGAHSETIYIDKFLLFYNKIKGENLDIMFEVKDKNLSAIKCSNVALNDALAKDLEVEWAKYKYFVLSKSVIIYNDIRELLKDKNKNVAKEFYWKIEAAKSIIENPQAEINAASHVWGYLNKTVSKNDKNRFNKLIEEYKKGSGKVEHIKKHLLKLANAQNIQYLINSLYFYI